MQNMSMIKRVKVLPRTGQPLKTNLNTNLMHKTHVDLTYKHIVSNYRLCDIKITILHTTTYEKTCWKLHTKRGQ